MAIKNPYNYTVPPAMRFKNLKGLTNQNEERLAEEVSNPQNNPINHYKEQKILTSPPEELTLMLYEGIVKFLNQGKLYIENKNMEKSHTALMRAQDIIYELNSTLNMDYEISHNHRSLYDFMIGRIIDANIKKDPAIIDEVLVIAEEMRDTWKQAMEIARK